MDHRKLIEEYYAAFGLGHVDFILDDVADDVEWVEFGHLFHSVHRCKPWARVGDGLPFGHLPCSDGPAAPYYAKYRRSATTFVTAQVDAAYGRMAHRVAT